MNIREAEQEVKGKSLAYISAALGLVAGLAWNEAIAALINALFPLTKDTVLMKFVYAGLVTAAVVVMIKYLDKLSRKEDNT
jgi:hypothetical protein